MKFFLIWILLILAYVWIVLKENTQLGKQPQEAHNSLNLYTLIYMGLLMLHLLVEKSIFFIFIDDFSCYGYIYLLHEKSQSRNAMRCLLMKLKDN